MRKIYTSFTVLAALLLAQSAQAQINYSMVAGSGSYTALSGATVAPMSRLFLAESAADEGYNNRIPLGFNFSYGGTTYDTVRASTNGMLRFGAPFVTGNSSYLDDLASPSLRNAIAPLWTDLRMNDSLSVSYQTIGTAGSRVFTIQYSNVYWPYTGSGPLGGFQVKLYEASGNIQFVYGSSSGASLGTGAQAAVGLSGTVTYQSLNAVTNQLSKAVQNYFTAFPQTGTTYTFSPGALVNNDLSVQQVVIAGKAGAGNYNHVVSARIANLGGAAVASRSAVLTVTGANSYTDIASLTNVATGTSGLISFQPFKLPVAGTNYVTVSVTSDDVNANNSATDTLVTGPTAIAHGRANGTRTGGVNAGNGGALLARFFAGTNSVTSASIQFDEAGANYTLLLYAKNPAGNGMVGAPVDSVVGLVSTAGINTVAFNTARPISDTFYVGVRQRGAFLQLSYLQENPLRPAVFAFQAAGATGFTDLAASTSNVFRMNIGVNVATSLPVQFGEFTGRKVSRTNVLDWTTLGEANNRGFEVQKSADGRSFSTIGFVNTLAKDGNSSETLKYSFVDEKAQATAYYRIMQVDKDGKTSFSKAIVLKGEDKSSLEITTVYPNPAVRQLNLAVVSAETGVAQLVVSDVNGRQVISQRNSLVKGDNQLSLNVSGLSNGTYYIKMVSATGEVTTQQFIKQ